MPAPDPSKKKAEDLSRALENLRITVERLPKEYGYLLQPGKNLLFTYLRGIVYGLGALTAVAIITPLIIAMLQRVQWVPLLGDFVGDIATRIQETQRR